MRVCIATLSLSLLLSAGCHRDRGHADPEPSVAAFVAPRATTDLEELQAFARLYGVVRYFHPSDEAAALDWEAFAVHGAARVTQGNNHVQLRDTLLSLFRPVAPTLDVYGEGETPRAGSALFPAETEGLEQVAWQHRGYGFGDMTSVYASARTNRTRQVPVGHQQRTGIRQEVPAEVVRGKTVRLHGWVHVDAEAPHATVRLHAWGLRPEGQAGFPHRWRGDVATQTTWDELMLEVEVPDDVRTFQVGAMVAGVGAAWVDELSLEVRGPQGWTPMAMVNSGFDAEDALEHWTLDARNYEVTGQANGHGDGRALRVARRTKELDGGLFSALPKPAELQHGELAAGLEYQLPLSLFSKDGQTLPRPDLPPLSLADTPRSAENPAVRTAAVVVSWNVFQHFYPYFDVIDTNWATVLEKSLARVQQDASVADTYETLQRMVSELDDGHGWVEPPSSVKKQRVPVSFGRVEGSITVLHTAEGDGLRPGDVVRSVDGRDVEEVLAELRERGSGSPHRVEHTWLSVSGITLGEPRGMVRFEIERDGTAMKLEVQRRDWQDPIRHAHEPIEALKGGVWYVDLSRAPWKSIEAKLDVLATAPGVVFDLRGYPKGANSNILGHLVSGMVRQDWMFVPQIIRPDHVEPSGWDGDGWLMLVSGPHIEGKVVFLTGPGAISYSESVLGYVEGHGLGEIVGSPSAGANGNVNPFTTPGGYEIRWTGMRVLKHDGGQHHGIGVTPSVEVARTLAGVRAGVDEVLERGLAVALGE
ncbi:MAG: hypothetical protein KUG77_11250 [Nannocystaceae bacterium]|nr:hypothetical protein [Nannocystaceae bacterium]